MPGVTTDTRVEFEWLDTLDAHLQDEVRTLFNASLEVDDVIGFPGPLATGVSDDYFDVLRFEMAARRKAILAGRMSDGTLVAMAVLTRNPLPNCAHLAEISKCVIHPSRRGTGVLGAGMARLLAFCVAERIEVLTLDVRKGTRAEALWLALGFQPFGELPDYARTGGQTHAGVYLWARVNELVTRERSRRAGGASLSEQPAA